MEGQNIGIHPVYKFAAQLAAKLDRKLEQERSIYIETINRQWLQCSKSMGRQVGQSHLLQLISKESYKIVQKTCILMVFRNFKLMLGFSENNSFNNMENTLPVCDCKGNVMMSFVTATSETNLKPSPSSFEISGFRSSYSLVKADCPKF